MRNIFDSLTWGFLLVFFIPVILIVASWNSLPGERLFSVKLGLERTLLVLASPSYKTTGALQIKFTERRFADAKRLLTEKHSVAGLAYLTQQVASAESVIEKAPSLSTKAELSQSYIATLTEVSRELEEEKRAITTAEAGAVEKPSAKETEAPPVPIRTEVSEPTAAEPTIVSTTISPPGKSAKEEIQPSPTPTPVVTAQVTTAVPLSPSDAIVALQITQTQKTIQKTIDNLKKITGEDKGKKEEEDKRDSKREKEKSSEDAPTTPGKVKK